MKDAPKVMPAVYFLGKYNVGKSTIALLDTANSQLPKTIFNIVTTIRRA